MTCVSPVRLSPHRGVKRALDEKQRAFEAMFVSHPATLAENDRHNAKTARNRPDGGEREQIALVLERTGGNVVRAARLLGLKRGALRYRMEKFDITKEWPYLSDVPGALSGTGGTGRKLPGVHGQNESIPCPATGGQRRGVSTRPM